jgi:hypothetical protein
MAEPDDRIELLNIVETHEERFLGLFALDCLIEDRGVFERLTVDLGGEVDGGGSSSGTGGWSINQ